MGIGRGLMNRLRWMQLLQSVRTKYTLTLLTVSLVPSAIYTTLEITRLEKTVEENGLNALEASARYNSVRIDNFLERGLNQVLAGASLPSLAQYLSASPEERGLLQDAIRNDLKSLETVNPVFISSIALLDNYGLNLIDTIPANEGKPESENDYVVLPLLTGEPVVSLSEGDVTALYFSNVVYDASVPIGILRIRYSVQALNHLLISGGRLSGRLSGPILLDEKGQILASGLVGYELQSAGYPDNGRGDPQVLLGEGQLTNQSPNLIKLIGSNDLPEEWAIATSPLQFKPWRLAYLQPYVDFIAPARRHVQLALLSGATVLFVVLGLGLLSVFFLVAPLRRLQRAATEIADGDLSARVRVTTRDEIGDVGKTFNEMADRLFERENALREAKLKAEDANRAKSQFLAIMSHEIRTPLNSIIGFGTLLSESEGLTKKQLRDIDRIRRASNSLLKLITDILDFSKIEAGQMKYKVRSVALDEVIAYVVELALPNLAGSETELFIVVDDNVPSEIDTDGQRLSQILTNLLTNALKFTDKGSVRLSLSMRDDTIVFRVIDSGIGISQEVREKLFKPFSQGDSSATRKYGGTGLGLVICQRLANALGGEVVIDPAISRGSCFELTLPAAGSSERSLLPKVDLSSFRGKILLIGESEASLLHHKGFLEDQPDVTIEMCDLDGFTQRDSDSDLLIIDIHNSMSPETFSGWIHLNEAALKQNPCLFLTNASGLSVGDECSRSRFEVIAKPLLQSDFIAAINRLTECRSAREDGSGFLTEAKSIPQLEAFKALVVEDDAMSGEMIGEVLQGLGASFTLVDNVVSGWDQIQTEGYDLLITDIHMSGTSGLQFIENIRDAEGVDVPILVTTADVSEETHSKIMKSGADHLIYKPIDKDKLVALIAKCLTIS